MQNLLMQNWPFQKNVSFCSRLPTYSKWFLRRWDCWMRMWKYPALFDSSFVRKTPNSLLDSCQSYYTILYIFLYSNQTGFFLISWRDYPVESMQCSYFYSSYHYNGEKTLFIQITNLPIDCLIIKKIWDTKSTHSN